METTIQKDSRLKKELGLLQLTALGVGAIIGAGIFIAPAAVASLAGPLDIFSWIVGGLAMAIIALFYAELGSLKPTTSGFYVYAKETSGEFTGFISGWGTFLSYATTVPIELFTIMLYLSSFVSGLTTNSIIPVFGSVSVLSYRGLALAISLLWLLTLINIIGVKYGGWYATITTGLKLAALFSFIGGGLFFIHPSNYGLFLPRDQAGTGVLLGVSATVFSYMGFRQPTDVGGEAKNGNKIVPLATLLSIAVATAVYLAVSIVFTGMVNWSAMGIPKGVWSSIPSEYTLAQVATSNGGLALGLLITIGIIISALGTAGVFTTTTARVPYQMAENGPLSKVHGKYATPYVSLLVIAVFQTFLIAFSIGYWALYYVSAISGVMSYGISGPLAAMIYRARGGKPGFRVPFGEFLAPLGFVAASFLIYWSGWPYTGYGVGFVITGLFAYLIATRKRGLLAAAREMYKAGWLLVYLIGLILLSYAGPSSFNGQNIIQFPYDEITVLAFSLAVYYTAYKSSPGKTGALISSPLRRALSLGRAVGLPLRESLPKKSAPKERRSALRAAS
ncbi:MAG: APC family permease [Thermoprotei archaeon]